MEAKEVRKTEVWTVTYTDADGVEHTPVQDDPRESTAASWYENLVRRDDIRTVQVTKRELVSTYGPTAVVVVGRGQA